MKEFAENENPAKLSDGSFLTDLFHVREDADKCYSSLSKLTQHIEGEIIITGGIATNWHLLKKGQKRKTKLNDIDVVVKDLSHVRASLNKDFLIRHFHPYRGQGRVLIMLVDEENGIRIDVFTPTTKMLSQRLTDFPIGNLSCKVVSAEDLLAKLLSVIYPIIKGKTIEPKYVEHFDFLYTIADLKTAEAVWNEYRKEDQPTAFGDATNAVQQRIRDNPELLRIGHYSQDISEVCQWCSKSDLFPLAPLSKIYEILGYV